MALSAVDSPHLIPQAALGYLACMRTGKDKLDLGQQGERIAEEFLRERHYTVITRNYRCVLGEIDLIVQDRDTLVFVEVRSQTGSDFGDPLESVTRRKQRQIAKAALHYVTHQRVENRPLRFDVIGIRWDEEGPRVLHVKDAFDFPTGR
jgi:putative endonuclease